MKGKRHFCFVCLTMSKNNQVSLISFGGLPDITSPCLAKGICEAFRALTPLDDCLLDRQKTSQGPNENRHGWLNQSIVRVASRSTC